jgi:hypothetical protein
VFVVQSRTILLNNLTKLFGGESWTSRKSQKKEEKNLLLCWNQLLYLSCEFLSLSPRAMAESILEILNTPSNTERKKCWTGQSVDFSRHPTESILIRFLAEK